MADVSGRLARESEDRGQLLLVSAIGLAALLVMLALVLNGVIYTENVAVRDSDARESLDAIRYTDDAVEVTRSLLYVENGRPAADYTTMEANLSRHLGNWSNHSAQHVARDAGVVWVDLTATQPGTRVVQNAGREMTNRSATTDWSVVEDATAVPVFDMTVARSSLVSVNETPANETELGNQGVFALGFETNTGAKRVYLYEMDDSVIIQQSDIDGSLDSSCQIDGAEASLDVVAGTVDGADCEALAFVLPPDSATDISFEHGSNASGTYELVVDRPAIDDDLHDVAGDDPYGERLLYDATISIRYSTPNLDYNNTDVVVSGGEWP